MTNSKFDCHTNLKESSGDPTPKSHDLNPTPRMKIHEVQETDYSCDIEFCCTPLNSNSNRYTISPTKKSNSSDLSIHEETLIKFIKSFAVQIYEIQLEEELKCKPALDCIYQWAVNSSFVIQTTCDKQKASLLKIITNTVNEIRDHILIHHKRTLETVVKKVQKIKEELTDKKNIIQKQKNIIKIKYFDSDYKYGSLWFGVLRGGWLRLVTPKIKKCVSKVILQAVILVGVIDGYGFVKRIGCDEWG